jgi:hypothetical protein
MNCAQIGVLKHADEMRLCRLLQSFNRCTLESYPGHMGTRNFTHESLEGQLLNEELSYFLILADFP